MKYFIIILITVTLQNASGNSPNVDQCYPKEENHTLCHGPDFLNSVSNFASLLRNSQSGFPVHHSNIWMILIQTKCHKDLEKLLCAIYAPTCLKGHQFTRIYPCPELCQSVMEKCLPRMKNYGFEWPAMVNCDQFQNVPGNECIQMTDMTEISLKQSKVKKQREDRSLNNTILSDEVERKRLKNCKVCHRKVSFEVLTKRYCESSLIIKAKIVQIFTTPKSDLSLRLHFKSKVLTSKHPFKVPLTNLMTEVQCSCPLLKKRFSDFRWLLFGDMDNGQFIVKFVTKWRPKHSKFKYLMNSLKSEPKSNCKRQRQLLKSVYMISQANRNYKRKIKG